MYNSIKSIFISILNYKIIYHLVRYSTIYKIVYNLLIYKILGHPYRTILLSFFYVHANIMYILKISRD